ncbi:diadenosine tetraphosphate (Ap4A) HIT family hydrolase [Modicisalibacter xianhensis]|uniref:Diadenosine tetraphosphate (Ap4A) HIT family hydrolase n=2 Tax=Modicisalibacter xianhensis TaxID=442341 RepID=A0A4R8G485_9GAMM|nr:diadenosine tetraphosphate (Ap4A) HIT family hydrolase [Halomonas xianhensis]
MAMNDFQLHPRLDADTHHLSDLPLCRICLMDDIRFPWLILVPRRADISEVHELSAEDQTQLWREATSLGHGMKDALGGDKLNIATLGNQVPQLHIHVILRRRDDAAWPAPVWGFGERQPYDADGLAEMRDQLLMLVNTLPDGPK